MGGGHNAEFQRGYLGRQKVGGGIQVDSKKVVSNLTIPYPSPAGGQLSLANYRILGVLRPTKN